VPTPGMPAVPLPPMPLEKRVAAPGAPSTPVPEVAVQALRDEFKLLPSRCEECEALAESGQ